MLADDVPRHCRRRPCAVDRLHAANAEPFEVRTINWFIPDIDSPFYGGINTALRIADQLARDARRARTASSSGAAPNDHFVRSAMAAAFPALRRLEIVFYDGADAPSIDRARRRRRHRHAVGRPRTRWRTSRARRGSST